MQKGRGCALTGNTAGLLIVKRTVYRNTGLRICLKEAAQRTVHTLQIIQPRCSKILLIQSDKCAVLAIVEEKIHVQHLLLVHARLLRDQLLPSALCIRIPEYRTHVVLYIVGGPFIRIPVHMNCNARNHEQIPVDADQLCLDRSSILYQYTSRNRKRTVKPRRAQCSAVLLDIELRISLTALQLRVYFYLKSR